MDPNTRALMMGAAGAGGAAAKTYVEDVFGTFLYTGNGSTQTITNGIDLSGKGGLVWIKGRSVAYNNVLNDTGRGVTQQLSSNQTDGQQVYTTGLTAFTSTGFSIGNNIQYNESSQTYASWTFRECPGFFDVVTYTGNGSNRTIAHSLGSVPGTIIVKRTNAVADWQVYHRSLANTEYLVLNSTAAKATGATRWNSTTPTSTEFSLGTDTTVNANGGTYVAYLFAHNAGGFGDSGNDSVVSCGSYTGDRSSDRLINLGWEAQWVLMKPANSAIDWRIYDAMRGIPISGGSNTLAPNTADTEDNNGGSSRLYADPLGFRVNFAGSSWTNETGINYIYIAIRRGPMKTPTDATTVFGLNARTGTGANATVTGGQVADAALIKNRGSAVGDLFAARLTGTGYLETSSTAAEVAAGTTILQANPWDVMDGVKVGTTSTITNASANTFINYLFRRAPGFFDVVAYTGTGIAHGEAHNLGVTPELVIWKERSTTSNWYVYQGFTTRTYGRLNLSNAFSGNTPGWFSSVTSTALNVCASSDNTDVNDSGVTYIAYLFATLTGISKVGSYTGTGTTLNIDCGFTNGARFVLIKRVNDVGDWYVWDTARGIIAANDPYLLLNSTAAEVTNTDFIDPLNSGFQISSTAPAAINANGGSFIYLAIA